MGFETEEDQVKSVITYKGAFTAGNYILAAGAWTSQFGKQLELRLLIQPAKGHSIIAGTSKTSPKIPCYFYEKRVVVTRWKSGIRLGGILELSGHNLCI